MENKFELIYENTQHSEMLGELKNEEAQCWENMRHERVVAGINSKEDNLCLEKDDWELCKE